MNKKVSIIFPVYNVEEHVEASLGSVLVQDYPNIELIIIDDCSPDGSMEIVNLLILNARSDISIKIIKHDINKGLSAARNTGIKYSSGDFLFFLDSDDCLSENCISLLLGMININSDIDFVVGNTKTIGGADENKYALRLKDETIEGNENISKAFYQGKWIVTAWNKLLKRDFILKNNLYFLEGILHEDELWSFKLTQRSNKVMFCHEFTYFYSVRSSSIMTKAISKFNVESFYIDIFEAKKCLKNNRNKYLSGYIVALSIRLMVLLSENQFSSAYSHSIIMKVRNTVSLSIIVQAMFLDLNIFLKSITFLLPLNLSRFYLKFIYFTKYNK